MAPGETSSGARTVVPHPLVHGLWIGGREASIDRSVDAVVSLCPSGDRWLGLEQLEFDLDDRDPGAGLVIDEAAQAVVDFLDQGRAVYLHGEEALSRTPIVAARVAVLLGAEPEVALTSVRRALPAASPSPSLMAAYRDLPHPWAGVDVTDPLMLTASTSGARRIPRETSTRKTRTTTSTSDRCRARELSLSPFDRGARSAHRRAVRRTHVPPAPTPAHLPGRER